MNELKPKPLTPQAFAPYGQVIAAQGASLDINQGFAKRFDDLARIDVAMEGGDNRISLFLPDPRPQPIIVTMMERHPLGSQAFVPLQDKSWLVIVCDDPHKPETYHCFKATGQQGINYNRGIWHHSLLVLGASERFLIIDRKGPGNNLEEVKLKEPMRVA